jgi:eukaryotic-like serine/threonine-protein kinase
MSTDGTTAAAPGRADELSAILAAYLEAIDRGEQPDRAALLTRHPQLAERLGAYFAAQDRLEQLAGPVRVESKVEATFLAYELLEEIGRGGMGVVLRCRDGALNRDLAIKVLQDCYRDRPDLVSRFIEEARITGQLQHPFIVPVHELGTLPDGRPYFAMKLVEGRTLAELLQERPDPAQDQPRLLQIFEHICQTIAYAHSKAVIHRDLKPSNVMVGTFGEVQVMDWGLAKAGVGSQESGVTDQESGAVGQTQAGAVLGTLAYMPPEQARGELTLVSRRSDVFGLGAILCEILTGAPPYTGEPATVREQARAGQTDEARVRLQRSGADAELIELAQCCLAAGPAERPADGAAVAAAMARYFAAVQERLRNAEIARARAETEAVEERKRMTLAEAKALAERKRGRAERHRRRATLLTALSLLLLLTAGAGFGLWYQSERSTRRAVTERDVAAALAEVRLRHEEGLKQADDPKRWSLTLTGARDALKRAENALELGEPAEALHAEVAAARALLEQDERDRTLFATLERLWIEAAMLSPEDVRAPRDASFLTRAFKDYGLDLDALDPQEAAALIQAHPHRRRLTDEINLVAVLQAYYAGKPQQRPTQPSDRGVLVRGADWTRTERLRRILDAVDADPTAFGTRWRAARAAGDRATLVRLAQLAEACNGTPRAAIGLAHDLLGVRAFNEARQLQLSVHERHPTDFWLNQSLGASTMASAVAGEGGSLDEAIGYLTAALASRGNNPATHILLSQLLKAQGQRDRALRAANAAIAADPISAPAHYNLANLFAEAREYDKALAEYHEAARLDRVSALPHDALGQAYFNKRAYDRAIEQYTIALEREPSYAAIYVNYGNALAAKNDLAGAIAKYDRAIELFPEYALAHHNKGSTLANMSKFVEAERCFRDALGYDANLLIAYYSLGKLLLVQRRDPPRAIECFQQATRVQPNNAEAHFALADVLQGQGQHAQAEPSLRKVIELNDRYPEAHARLGIALAARGDWDGAIVAYRTALAQDPNRAVIHDCLGTALLNKGKFADALVSHRDALAIDPLAGKVPFNIGNVQMALGNLEEAAESYGEALRHDKNNPMYHVRLAKVLNELFDQQRARFHAQTALDLGYHAVEAYHTLATVHWDGGDFAAGMATVRQAQAQVSQADPQYSLLRRDQELAEQCLRTLALAPAVLYDGATVTDPADKGMLAMTLGLKYRRYAAACRLFAEVFAEMPAVANTVSGGARLNAACFAARAGTGYGEPDPTLDRAEQARLRKQALDWLRAELDGWQAALKVAPLAEHGVPRFRVRSWLINPHFDAVRRSERLQQLPAAEQREWATLWADIAAFGQSGAIPALRQGPDIARLRKLTDFPSVAVAFDFKIGLDDRDSRGNRIDPARKIAELLPRLDGSIADADTYVQLAGWHRQRKEEDKARDLAQKAQRLLDRFLKTSDPKEVDHLLTYLDAHAIAHPAGWEERESHLRRAVEVAPKDWRARQLWGRYRLLRAEATVLGGRLTAKGKRNEAVEQLLGGKTAPATLAAVEALLAEARQSYDRARALAPAVEEQWDGRIAYLFLEAEWINALRVARGMAPLPAGDPVAPELLARGWVPRQFAIDALPDLPAECREAAERCPQHLGMQCFSQFTFLPRVKARARDRAIAKDPNIPLMTAQEIEYADEVLARIEQIRTKALPETAVYCDRILLCFQFELATLGTPLPRLPKIELHARRLVEADANDQDAAEVLEYALVEQGRHEAALAVAKARAAQRPSIRNRYLLARSLVLCGQTQAAASELDAALVMEPGDPYCLAGRAVLLLRENTDPAAWAEAARYLTQARAAIKPGERKQLAEDVEFLSAIAQALTGQPILARITLQSLCHDHEQAGRYREALEALGQ